MGESRYIAAKELWIICKILEKQRSCLANLLVVFSIIVEPSLKYRCDKILVLRAVHIGFRWLAGRSKAITTFCPLIITIARKRTLAQVHILSKLVFDLEDSISFKVFFSWPDIARWPNPNICRIRRGNLLRRSVKR